MTVWQKSSLMTPYLCLEADWQEKVTGIKIHLFGVLSHGRRRARRYKAV